MRAFIWVQVALAAIAIGGHLSDLANGHWTKASEGVKAWSIVIQLGFVAWALVLLL